MTKFRREFGQRLQHEAALRHSRMRNFQIGRGDHGLAEKYNVDVDDARAFRNRAFAAHVALDLLKPRKQLAREQRGFSFDDLIQKPRLAGYVARRGFINPGRAQNANVRGGQTIAGACQVFQAIA